MKTYRLAKCKKILLNTYGVYKKKKFKLQPHEVDELEKNLKALEQAILQKNLNEATIYAVKCEESHNHVLKKSFFEHLKDFIFALIFALVVALLIRQLWFELYEIPTGSMRPTFKEEDRLVVSKNSFGINLPLSTKHLYFDPKLVQRCGIFIFTVENMDVRDPDTLYFYLFPGKKQFVKRVMAKPGDIVYFYGGQLYGIDKEGNDITPELQPATLEQIDHIPFIRFEGNTKVSDPTLSPMGELYRSVVIYQMNEPVARLNLVGDHRIVGEMLPLTHIHDSTTNLPNNYGELWGIQNFATAKLLSKKQLKSYLNKYPNLGEEGDLFLELKHHPSLSSLKLGKDPFGRLRPMFHLSQSILPLNESQLRLMFDHLYTARFNVKNGFASRYTASRSKIMNSHFLPQMANVPDGCYEFYHGKAYQIKWGGVAIELPKEHPLCQFSIERMQLFFNLGIDFDMRYALDLNSEFSDTSRYAYFRNGDLYVMGAPLLKKEDGVLVQFIEREMARAQASTPQSPYLPFVDAGAPLKDGKLDREKILRNGLRIPEEMYLALGDNYAMSSDSRDFGFVPQGNIRGSPSFIFWPPGSRWGSPLQPQAPCFVFPRVVVWSSALVLGVIWYTIYRRKNRLPLKF